MAGETPLAAALRVAAPVAGEAACRTLLACR